MEWLNAVYAMADTTEKKARAGAVAPSGAQNTPELDRTVQAGGASDSSAATIGSTPGEENEGLLPTVVGSSENDSPELADTVAGKSDAPDRKPTSSPGLSKGDTLGRYVILGSLGAGGMGVVYRGYDPELRREVALKLLQARLRSGRGEQDAQSRLLREAQAMARLSHPNIVSVYDVGTWEGHVYVAMEKVDGKTLTDWLAEETRPWTEIIDAFLQAGEGLAAAHEAELVHRDFKPDNVLVGSDGRVRVMDFGLAREISDEPETSQQTDPLESTVVDTEDPLLSAPLTRTGSVLGTPVYMSPEQHRGEPADARSDQFSFSVALYEGLCGTRPFVGNSMAEILRSIEGGSVEKPLPGRRVPHWLLPPVRLGLSVEAVKRHPTMSSYLQQLTRARNRPRRLVLSAVAVVVLLLVGVGIGLYINSRHRAEQERQQHAEEKSRVQKKLASTQAKLTDHQKASKKHYARLVDVRKRRLQLIEQLQDEKNKLRRDEIMCQIAGLEDVIQAPGKTSDVGRRLLRDTIRRCVYVLRSCYNRIIAKKPEARAQVRINFQIGAQGDISNLNVEHDTGQRDVTDELRPCLQKKIMRWKLPATGRQVKYGPFGIRFSPGKKKKKTTSRISSYVPAVRAPAPSMRRRSK